MFMTKWTPDRGRLGKLGESLAVKLLKRQGYQILEKNYRCRFGEVDLIAKEGEEIVFVEVKSRRGTSFGFPREQISRTKRKHLQRLAQYYMKKQAREMAIRIDVVAILFDSKGNPLKVETIPNAIF
ncbi:MAG: YraN family protein [Candidatus Omnitrophota bacterium]